MRCPIRAKYKFSQEIQVTWDPDRCPADKIRTEPRAQNKNSCVVYRSACAYGARHRAGLPLCSGDTERGMTLRKVVYPCVCTSTAKKNRAFVPRIAWNLVPPQRCGGMSAPVLRRCVGAAFLFFWPQGRITLSCCAVFGSSVRGAKRQRREQVTSRGEE